MSTVLIVDDEPIVGRAMRRLLSSHHSVTLVGSAEEALARLRAGERFDAIVSDIHMPGLDGIGLFQEVLQVAPEQCQRFIFLSGGHRNEEQDRFFVQHDMVCLLKPFSTTHLPRVVAEVVASRPRLARLPAAAL